MRTEFLAFLEGYTRHDLAAARLSSLACRAAVKRVNESEAGGQRVRISGAACVEASTGTHRWSSRIGGRRIEPGDIHKCRIRQIQAVENVLELRPDVEVCPFAEQAEIPTETQRFRRLPLPAEVIVVGGGRSELAGRRIRPRGWIQHELRGGVEALAIGVEQKQILALDPIPERVPSAENAKRIAERLCEKAIAGSGTADQLSTLVTEQTRDDPISRQP